ncbi:hypothetical protein AD942_11040 [Gluconobacter japonicus]|uniref:hypothetical protein n=1 Tax=Gluconobacter japonicus TaxID=376620 RepID=UPI000782A93E|nr:hypothetical protein [Gluconobacter japonicus]KXV23861.1 hypothetical protein AD936_20995 [Gluconobacter japonicus]KXV39284.1 hypothetical protein AD942_11040 [Gluconobacter japonicus]
MSVDADIETLQAEIRALVQIMRDLLFSSLQNSKDPKKFLDDFRIASDNTRKNLDDICVDLAMQGMSDVSSKADDTSYAVERFSKEIVEGISIGD